MPNPKNIKGKGFDKKPENINRNGRPISIKNQLKELLLNEGELPIPASSLIKEIEKDGIKYYIFKIPTQNALAMRLLSIAMSKNTSGFNALKLLLETFDGRAVQEILTPDLKIELTDQERKARIDELLKKQKKK